MEKSYRLTVAVFLGFLTWFTILAFMHIPFGILGLGVLMLFGGVWMMASAKGMYESAKKTYKKLPKSKQTTWNKPSDAYYYFNLFVIIPAMITIGIICFYMVWFVV